MSVNGQYLSEQTQQTGPAPAAARMYLEVSPFNSDASQGHGRYYELSEFLQADNNLSELANAATARQNLGVEIGVDVQAFDDTLQSLSSLGTAADKFAYTTGIDTWAESTVTLFGRSLVAAIDNSAARTILNVDVAGTDNSTPVTLAGALDYLTLVGQQITRNAIDLATDVTGALPIANGGSGQTSQQAAIDALTNVAAATIGHVLTKDGSGNATYQAAAAALTIREVDGTPSVANVDTIVVSNGTLTDDGGGQVTITTGGGGGSTLPVADTTAIIKGSVDDTKLLRLEVDTNLTTSTTRVWTAQDTDLTVAGIDVAQTITAAQTFNENLTIDTADLIINPVDTTNDIAISVGSEFQVKKVSTSGYRILGRGFNTIAAADSDGFGLLTSANTAQYLNTKGLFLGDVYIAAQAPGSAEIRTHTGNPILTLRPGGATTAKFQSYRMSLGFAANWSAVLELDNANHTTEDHLHVTQTTAGDLVCIDENGRLGLRAKNPAALAHFDQSSTTGAIPVLLLDQADVDQPFIKLIGTSDSGSANRSLVSATDFTTPGSIVAWEMITIQDDRVGGLGTQTVYRPLYGAPTA